MTRMLKKNQIVNMLRVGALAMLFVFLTAQSASAQPAGQAAASELFGASTDVQERSVSHLSAEVIRARWTEVDFSVLVDTARSGQRGESQGGPAFVFNLFVDVRYPAYVTQVFTLDHGSWGMTGTVSDSPYNEFVIVFREGVLQATIQDGPSAYEVRYQEGGHWIVEVDSSAYPDSLEPQAAGSFFGGQQGGIEPRENPPPAADSGAVIDVLAVYTPAARIASGGIVGIETKIQQAIVSTNQGYANSGVAQQVELVGMEEVSYSETIPGATDPDMWYIALNRLTSGRDGADPPSANYLADARAYREEYGADLVFMVTDLPDLYCGLGWLAGSSSADAYGYSVVHRNCTGTTAYSVQHEMGHNMGACHDRNNTSSGALLYCYYSYSFGYQRPNQFYTVMAYSSGCGSCYRINRWSNPDLTYNGFPTGVPIDQPNSAANAFTLNGTAYNVANYRQSKAISAAFIAPGADRTAMIPRTILSVSADSRVGTITQITFKAYYDNVWHTLYVDTNPSDGWNYQWPTYHLSEQTIILEAIVVDSVGNERPITLAGVSLTRTFVNASGFGYRADGRNDPAQAPVEEPAEISPVAQISPELSPIIRLPSRYPPRGQMLHWRLK